MTTLQGYARVYDQSENKEIGGRGAKLGGGAKTFGGGAMAPPPAGYGPGLQEQSGEGSCVATSL